MEETTKMKKISLSEFKDYYTSSHFNKIIFESHNQTWNSADSSLHISFEFDKMNILFNPNVICLQENTNLLKLKRVKGVKIPDESSLLGQVFIIVCADMSSHKDEKEYTLVMR